ncbi:hypothetical protein FACS1894201_01540 [Bacteroidia bacterium]|nr:hypothetical protein FACS1894201_01540 [Bacteroidia bacterium]
MATNSLKYGLGLTLCLLVGHIKAQTFIQNDPDTIVSPTDTMMKTMNVPTTTVVADTLLTITDANPDTAGVRKTIAQKEGGSKNRGTVFTFTENIYNAGIPDFKFIDTITHDIHRYNPIEQDDIFRTNRGNLGLISQPIEYTVNYAVEQDFGYNPFDIYRLTYANTPFFQSREPYSELFYTMGLGQEQMFRVVHAQNVWKGLNIGGEYRAINSKGRYERSYTKHNNARAFANFISKNSHYRAVAAYYFNGFAVNENGGLDIAVDSFAQYADQNENMMPVKLSSAERRWKDHSFYAKQSYHLGIGRRDTVPNSGIDLGYLSHSIKVDKRRTDYNDNALLVGNYPNVFRDSSLTQDSVRYWLMRNTALWSLGDVVNAESNKKINLAIGLTHTLHRISVADSLWINYHTDIDAFAQARIYPLPSLVLFGGMCLPISNKDIGNNKSYNAELQWFFDEKKRGDNVALSFDYAEVLPSPMQEYYISNHYQWSYDYENTENSRLKAALQWKGFRLIVENHRINRSLYLTESGFQQAPEAFTINKLVFEKNFKVGILALDNRIIYQKLSSEQYLHLPTFLTRNALYLDFVLLKHTPIQVGVEISYNTRYYADNYNPALGLFYYQDAVKTGDFIYGNAFIDLKIARANLFFKLENITAGWLGYNYIMTDNYPTYTMWFKFGFLWRFYD